MSKRAHKFRWKLPDDKGQSSPTWKETYRQRCMDRLRDKRFQHLLARRQPDTTDGTEEAKAEAVSSTTTTAKVESRERMMRDIQAVMSTEWDFIKEQTVTNEEGESVPVMSLDEMIALMDDIVKEFSMEKQEEERWEEFAEAEQDELCQSFHRLSAVEVTCPICQKDRLEEGLGRVFCSCGLVIDTEQDCISLKNVSDNLRDGVEEHDQRCEHPPSFAQVDQYGISTLVMSCQECAFHFIVI